MSKTDTKAPSIEIKVDQKDKMVFPTVAFSEITSSDKLCKDAKALFDVFGDFIGFSANFNPVSGLFTFSAFFKQIEDANGLVAFARNKVDKSDNNSGLRRIMNFERIANEGNKFYLTDEAAQAIAPFMHRAAYDSKGEVNFKMNGVVVTRALPNPFSAPVTYSVINFIDPIKLLAEMYGSKANIYVDNDPETGAPIVVEKDVQYQIVVLGNIATTPVNFQTQQVATNTLEGPFKLDIRQVDVANTHAAAKEVGLNIQVGPRIIQ